VQHDLGLGALGVAVAVQAHALAGRQLHIHLVIGQPHRVVARLRALVLVAETRTIAAERPLGIARLPFGLSAVGHQQHIAQIGVAAAGEVCVREAQDAVVVIAVAGRPRVALAERPDLRVRAQLHHAEWPRGAGEGVAVAAGADEDIHGRRGRGLGKRSRWTDQCQRQRASRKEGFNRVH
ncbi:conserved hypothetical protein, partial [Ricinus communis]